MRTFTCGQWNYFRNGSPLCPSFYALQGVTDYICNSNFLEFTVPTVLHLARRGFFRLLHWLQEQPTSVVLQNVCVFLSDSGAPEEDALSTHFRPADPCEGDPIEEPDPDPANLKLYLPTQGLDDLTLWHDELPTNRVTLLLSHVSLSKSWRDGQE